MEGKNCYSFSKGILSVLNDNNNNCCSSIYFRHVDLTMKFGAKMSNNNSLMLPYHHQIQDKPLFYSLQRVLDDISSLKLSIQQQNAWWYSFFFRGCLGPEKVLRTLKQSLLDLKLMLDHGVIEENRSGRKIPVLELGDIVSFLIAIVVDTEEYASYESLNLPHICKYIQRLEEAKSELCSDTSRSTEFVPMGRKGFYNLPKPLQKCFLYTSLFPKEYEFEKDTLVSLWIAAGFVVYTGSESSRDLEEIAGDNFDKLLAMSLLKESIARYSVEIGDYELFYKVEDDAYNLVKEDATREFFRLNDVPATAISEDAQHVSMLFEVTAPSSFQFLQRSNGLRSIVVLYNHLLFSIRELPSNLFLSLRCLRVLVMNQIHIVELPNSVGNLKDLHYLDLSDTLIESLPESLTNCFDLQMLRLRQCRRLKSLPSHMKNLVNLRYLDFDILRQLSSMPLEIGKLTNLRKLSAFIVDNEYGRRLEELKELNNIRGALEISRLGFVRTKDEAKRARLNKKSHLRKLVLNWSRSCIEASNSLDGLEPHRNLEELEIKSYGGFKFPSWFGNSVVSKLSTINLYSCDNCNQLPPLGQLPLLKSLHILRMRSLLRIDHQFRGELYKGFPTLEKLFLEEMPCLEEWTGVQKEDFDRLRELVISSCPMLLRLPDISHLTSLHRLEISNCPKLRNCLQLPTSLQCLEIDRCPLLEERYCKEKGVDWHKIANIPSVRFYR